MMTTHGDVMRWILSNLNSTSDCLKWPFAHFPSGRAKMRHGKKVTHAARVICEIVHGPAPTAEHESAHSCGVGWCVNGQHVRWATKDENEQDKVLHDVIVKGETHPNSKITESDVKKIRQMAGQKTMAQIGVDFGICRANVSYIIRRETWKHVE